MSPRKETGKTNKKPAPKKRATRKPVPKKVEVDSDIFSADVAPEVKTEDVTETPEQDIIPEVVKDVESSLDIEQAELDKMKKMKKILEEKHQTFLEISKLEKQNEAEKEAIDKAKENQKKRDGIQTRGKYDFTPEEVKKLCEFDGSVKNGVYYQFSVTEESPRQAIAICGQAFNRHAQVREDGNCPTCAVKMGKKTQKRTPIVAGQSRPACPVCGGILDYSKKDEANMVKIKQKYVSVTGDTLWLIAMTSNTMMVEVKRHNNVTNRNEKPVNTPAVEFVTCERIIYTMDNKAIQETQRIDFHQIYDHYQKTGEKKIFKFESAPLEELKKRDETVINIF